jgi:hypothetical protein
MQPTISKMIMAEVSGHNQQYNRPYQMGEINQSLLNQFSEMTYHGHDVTPTSIAGIAGQLIAPGAEASAMVNIANGWAEKRFRFMMQVDYATGLASNFSEIICGYTDGLGVNPSTGSFDLNMRFFINTCIMVNRATRWNTHTNQEQGFQTVSNASHILALQNAQATPIGQTTRAFATALDPRTMTPEDLMGNLSMDAIISSGRIPPGTIDLRNMLTATAARKSNRNNGIAPNYLARALNAITKATYAPDAPTGADNLAVMTFARDQVRELVIANDIFMNTLMTTTSYRDYQSVAWGELCNLFPELQYDSDNRVAVSFRGNLLAQGPATLGYGQSLGGATMENMLVTKLAQSVPAIMMELMIVDITFEATNQTHDGGYMVKLSEEYGEEPVMFVDIDPIPYVRRFTDRLISEVLCDISSNSMIPFGFWMHCEVMGNTFITLQFAGNPPVEYSIPSFCDALTAPILSFMPQQVDAIAADIAQLAKNHTSY